MHPAGQHIRGTLMHMILMSCGTALAITVSAFLGYELLTFRHARVQQLQTLSTAIASNSTAALAFENADDARVVLEAFRADPHIVAAALYDMQGQLFATYPDVLPETAFPEHPGAAGYSFSPASLRGFQPVMEGKKLHGTLYVESDLDATYQRLGTYALVAVVVTALSSLAAWLISRRLQHRLLHPIHALAETARAVSNRNDYSVRATTTGTHEFDLLTDAFNHMLEQIQRSGYKLQAQLGRLDLLQQITHAIGNRQDLQSIYQVVFAVLEQRLRISFACVLNHDPASRTLFLYSIGPASRIHTEALGLHEGVAFAVADSGLSRGMAGELVYEPDVTQVAMDFPRRFAATSLRSMVVAPLIVEKDVAGLLVCVREQEQAFSSSDCEFLRQLSEHVALAGHQIALYSSLQQAYDDLRQSQQTVLQQERLRALGEMASGIAHDINNAVSPVSLYTDILLEHETSLSDRARQYLTTIQNAISDVSRTVARMREFYRERETQLTLDPVNLNRAVEQILVLTRPRWSDQPQQRGSPIDLQTFLAPDLPDIMGADNEIRDALTNLVFNAVDAMPSGGTLTVRTFAKLREADERYVVVEVTDTGIGMDAETRDRCLEPFYTTKGDRGTGLGLAMVYGMVKRHSAQLEIDSKVGRGTTMRLIFAAASSSLAMPPQAAVDRLLVRPLRILLVDDDPMLLRSLEDSLQADGHSVTATNGGQAGIDTFTAALRRGAGFDLAITDLGMPFVDGRKVAASIKAVAPATPVILLTGWGQRMLAENETPAHIDKVLSKPPRLQELRAAFLELLP